MGDEIPAWFSFDDVIEILRTCYPARHQHGFAVFFTGLSGAGVCCAFPINLCLLLSVFLLPSPLSSPPYLSSLSLPLLFLLLTTQTRTPHHTHPKHSHTHTQHTDTGKSTVANALMARLMELTTRSVSILDGDAVRQQLSSELGFSKEHRDLNIRRIGFVASEITKAGGIALTAAIGTLLGKEEEQGEQRR